MTSQTGGSKLTAKEYLGQVEQINELIAAKRRTLQGLEDDAKMLKSMNTNGSNVKNGTMSDPLRVVDKIEDEKTEINAKIDKLIDLKAEINLKIERVYNLRFIALLTDLYINGLSFSEAAEVRKVAERTIHRWHGEALQIFRRENKMK